MSDGRARPGAAPAPASPTPWVLLGLVALVAAVHGRSVGFGFVYDDRWTILDNPVVAAPGNLARLLGASLARANVPDAGRPLMLASVMFDWALVGARPWLFHLHNVVLHAAVTCLSFLTLRRYGVALKVAALAAALFAVHPLLIEPVAVINYREDLLAALFVLVALRLAVTAGPWGRGAAALAALAAVAAKENAMLLPLLFLVLTSRLAATGTHAARLTGRALVVPTAALALPAGLGLAWRWWVFGAPGVVSLTAEIPPAHHALGFTLPRGALTFAQGLGQFLLPRGLAPEYPDLPDTALVTALGWAALVAVVAITALAIARLLRPAGASPGTWVALGWLWAVIAYLPHLGLVPLTNLRADRYFYLPALGLALAVATVLVAVVARLPARAPTVTAAGVVALLAALGTRSLRHGRVFRDDLALFTVAAAADPGSQRALVGLCAARLRAGQSLAALAAAEAALALGEAARPREMRGIVLMTQGDTTGAIRDLEAALAQAAPTHRPQVLFNLGLARERAGDRAGAARALRESARLSPLWPLPARALERLEPPK